jgi:hypothetical protein
MFVVDLGSDRVWILDRETGRLPEHGRPDTWPANSRFPTGGDFHSLMQPARRV